MDYEDAISYLYSKAPMFTNVGKSAYKANLNNSIALDNYFRKPHKAFKCIHVAGTNGKGSVSHTLAAVLQDSGYKTGLYSSPHLKDFRERIKINGIKINKKNVIDFIEVNKTIIEKIQPSFFEITTFMAFEFFKKEKIDIAVIETGLGGRLDTTNLIHPILSIITNIGWDHADLLGDSLQKIAFEKAGIIKPKTPVIIGEHKNEIDNIFINIAKKQNAKIIFAQDKYFVKNSYITQNNLLQLEVLYNKKEFLPGLKFQLIGKYQEQNVPTILTAIDFLIKFGFNITTQNIYRGFNTVVNTTGILGRWQIIHQNPIAICDIGHNYPAIKCNMKHLQSIAKEKIYFVLGFVKDKDIDKILPLLPTEAYYFFCQANIPRAMNAEELKKIASKFNLKGEVIPQPRKAYQQALSIASKNDVIYVGGSTFVIAEVI